MSDESWNRTLDEDHLEAVEYDDASKAIPVLNEAGHKTRPLSAEEKMPPYPVWRDGELVVPTKWTGELSEMEFESRYEEEGTLLMATIPGETDALITALCTDAEGLMDTYFGLDAAIAVASHPEDVPDEFLRENSMQLSMAATMLRYAAESMSSAMEDAFRSPDHAAEFDAQLAANMKGAESFRTAADRIEGAMAKVISPLLMSASRERSKAQTLH